MEPAAAENVRIQEIAAELARIPAFEGLADEQLAWFVANCREFVYNPGDVLSHEGDTVETMQILLEGRLESRRESLASELPMFIAEAGEITGALPFSRLAKYPGTARATLHTRVLRFPRSLFPELMTRLPLLGQRLVGVMADRIREWERNDQQQEKLAALGRLSAGLAHEMNNPAAAIRRAASSLKEAVARQAEAACRLSAHGLDQATLDAVARLERNAVGRAESDTEPLDSLAASDLEEELTSWLESRGLRDAWKTAGSLVEAGFTKDMLENMTTDLEAEALCDLLTHAAATLNASRLATEIELSAGRISDLVKSIKQYSFMDQAPDNDVDLHQGLDSTLVMLKHRWKHGIELVREYDRALPPVPAHGSELNQVWTNLIDNAVDAMNGNGRLRIRTARELDRALVEIQDNGPGIRPEIRPRIFEPFFTTKPVGKGSGLGLDTVYRIVRKHGGEIRVQSRPGETCFQVRLPLSRSPKGNDSRDGL